ncbi:uncharacterized protein HMPREF1541_00003, partial [Cyphellophora europaea CBS 101466]
GYSDAVRTVVFSPDSTLVASRSDDNTVRLWDVVKGESVAELQGHSDTVITVAFLPDGTLVASGSWDETVQIYHARG